MSWEKKADSLLKSVADDWASLRKSDVFRLFDGNDDYWWTSLEDRLKEKRPDLAGEAKAVVAELLAEDSSRYEYYPVEDRHLDDDRDKDSPFEYSENYDWSRHDFDSDPDWR